MAGPLDRHRDVSPSLEEAVSKGLMQGAGDDLVSHLQAVVAPGGVWSPSTGEGSHPAPSLTVFSSGTWQAPLADHSGRCLGDAWVSRSLGQVEHCSKCR